MPTTNNEPTRLEPQAIKMHFMNKTWLISREYRWTFKGMSLSIFTVGWSCVRPSLWQTTHQELPAPAKDILCLLSIKTAPTSLSPLSHSLDLSLSLSPALLSLTLSHTLYHSPSLSLYLMLSLLFLSLTLYCSIFLSFSFSVSLSLYLCFSPSLSGWWCIYYV